MMNSIVFSVLALLIAAVVYIAWRKWEIKWAREPSFNDRFPPISDEEFLARCPPGTDPRIALGVRRIVSEQLCIEQGRIYPESRFVEDLRAD
jgi:hypothetical protein